MLGGSISIDFRSISWSGPSFLILFYEFPRFPESSPTVPWKFTESPWKSLVAHYLSFFIDFHGPRVLLNPRCEATTSANGVCSAGTSPEIDSLHLRWASVLCVNTMLTCMNSFSKWKNILKNTIIRKNIESLKFQTFSMNFKDFGAFDWSEGVDLLWGFDLVRFSLNFIAWALIFF